ncbi:MAG: hypothetical protein R3E79_42235 [Caldilineaceae bacterium]
MNVAISATLLPSSKNTVRFLTQAQQTAVAEAQLNFAPLEIITSPASAIELAAAIGITSTDLITAKLLCGDTAECITSPGASVFGMAPGTWFPTQGDTFAVLATGSITDALAMDLYSSNPDLIRLQLRLHVPQNYNCLSIDFTFYTIDLPLTYEGQTNTYYQNNDTFTAQINNSSLYIITDSLATSKVVAPGNFAVNALGEMVSVNTMAPISTALAMSGPSGTTYPGVFELLKARTKVTPDTNIDLYLSIQDVGDDIGNSAVALDNFVWSQDTECSKGASGDTDSDGLPDGWEIYGRSFRAKNGKVEIVDLPAMGADPYIKDVFVEIDYMEKVGAYDPQPIASSMQMIVHAFAMAPVDNNQGIHLHVDYGEDALLTWHSKSGNDPVPTWGNYALSRGGRITSTQEFLGQGSCWQDDPSIWPNFYAIKQAHFSPSRDGVFHYGVFAHMLMNCSNLESTSGVSSNLIKEYFVHGASEFIITLGNKKWWKAPSELPDIQAGTFMHELGHNFGLTHQGRKDMNDQLNYKPNHLSVMNYLYQTRTSD